MGLEEGEVTFLPDETCCRGRQGDFVQEVFAECLLQSIQGGVVLDALDSAPSAVFGDLEGVVRLAFVDESQFQPYGVGVQNISRKNSRFPIYILDTLPFQQSER